MTLYVAYLVIAIAIIAISYYWFKHVKEPTHDSVAETVDAPVAKDASDEGISSLMATNLRIRKERVPPRLRSQYERLIDELMALLPRVNEQAPDGDLAWVINKMANAYLPEKSVNPYLSLSKEKRDADETIDAVIESLDGMMIELKEVEDLLNTRAEKDFDAKAKFLKHRFEL